MAAGDVVIARLRRTMQTIFRIGTIQIKDSGSVIQGRNAADSAYADIAGKNIRVQGNNASNAIVLAAPNSLSGNVTLTFPEDAGTSNYFLKTDGSGTLTWSPSTSNADLTQSEAFTQATTSPITLFTPPASSVIRQVIVVVSSAAAGGAPTLSIGISGDTDVYMDELDIDLLVTGTYIVEPMVNVGGTPDPVTATITPDSQSFGGTIYAVYTNPS